MNIIEIFRNITKKVPEGYTQEEWETYNSPVEGIHQLKAQIWSAQRILEQFKDDHSCKRPSVCPICVALEAEV